MRCAAGLAAGFALPDAGHADGMPGADSTFDTPDDATARLDRIFEADAAFRFNGIAVVGTRFSVTPTGRGCMIELRLALDDPDPPSTAVSRASTRDRVRVSVAIATDARMDDMQLAPIDTRGGTGLAQSDIGISRGDAPIGATARTGAGGGRTGTRCTGRPIEAVLSLLVVPDATDAATAMVADDIRSLIQICETAPALAGQGDQ